MVKVVSSGVIRDSNDVLLAEKVFELKKAKDYWGVVDLLLKAWAKKAPEEVESMNIQIHEYRENLVDKRFGQTVGGRDQERRFTLSIPIHLRLMIGAVFKGEDEFKIDGKFFSTFAKRYPFFKVAEKQ